MLNLRGKIHTLSNINLRKLRDHFATNKIYVHDDFSANIDKISLPEFKTGGHFELLS